MKNYEIINGNFIKNCTGCGACKNICPVNAIEIEENTDGFLYPIIDQQKCINCGKCNANCPINHLDNNNYDNPECLAVWANEPIRIKCSSGGVFGAIAEKFIEQGYYVSGAIYKDINHVEHIVTNSKEDLQKIIGSKYVQSDTKNCYKQIKELLKDNKTVLFCGCPCQIAGLYNVVGKNTTNLYTMDLICHGVPSYKFYRKYLEEYHDIKSIDFRDKSVFGWSTEINILFNDGHKFNKRHENDTFYQGFLPCLVQRPSCGTCKFASLPRIGDLTIGDFWGIEHYNKKYNDKKGTSVVLINNPKGNILLQTYKAQFSLLKKVPIEEALRINKNIKQPLKPHFARDRFFRDFDIVPDMKKLIKDCKESHYDVGIVGLWFGLNFGSVLTYYALYKVINNLGYTALMINKPDFMWIARYEDPNTIAQKFIRKHCNVSMVRNKSNLKELSNHCNSFVVGSDVVWNYEICGKTAKQFFFLDFVDDKCKKISYASSLGTGYNAPNDEYNISKYYLQKFDAVSVREQEAADICKTMFDIDADLVMDPVFLCDKKNYDDIADESTVSFPQNFIGAYILGPNETKTKMLEQIQRQYKLPFRILPNPNAPDTINELHWNPKEIVRNAQVEDFLSCLKNSDYFFADSFHGLCFALIFNKNFVVVTGKHQKDNCRFINLLKTVNALNRLVFIEDFIDNPECLIKAFETPLNYAQINTIIFEKATLSLNWLKNNLEKEKIAKTDIVDYLFNKNIEQANTISSMNKELNAIKQSYRLAIAKILHPELLETNNTSNYLDFLASNRKDKIIVVAACDTLGLSLNTRIQTQLMALGIKNNLVNQHWKGYLAIIDDNNIVFEKLATNVNERVEFKRNYKQVEFEIKSYPYNNGNKAEISINGQDYSLNKRGLNIVVYDTNYNIVIDSVNIDTHVNKFPFTR